MILTGVFAMTHLQGMVVWVLPFQGRCPAGADGSYCLWIFGKYLCSRIIFKAAVAW
jgi:hypothetical protein